MDNITFGKYIPINSTIHQLDPRLKILALLIFLIAIFFDAGSIGYAIMAIFTIGTTIISNINLKHILKAVKPMLFMMLFLMIFNIFLIKTGELLVSLGFIKIYSDALLQSAYIFIRLVLIITMTTILTSSTKPLDLTLAIEDFLNPLKKIGFPSHELAMMISIALRFIPTLFNETNKILKAQASRGVDFNEGKFREQIKQIVSLLVPMFVISIKRAEDLADAMEARGYIPGAVRTKLVKMKCHLLDYVVLFVVLTLFILLILGRCGLYAL